MKFKITILILFFVVFYVFQISCNQNSAEETDLNPIGFFCSAENLSADSTELFEVDYNLSFAGLNNRVNNTVHSGDFSILMNDKNIFSFAAHVFDFEFDELYELSVWKKGDSKIVVVVQSDTVYYNKSFEIIEEDDNGWQKVALYFSIPQFLEGNEFKLYVWNVGKEEVYVDDFSLIKKDKADFFDDQDTALVLYFDEKQYEKILQNKNDALQKGLLITEDDSWAKAFMLYSSKDYSIKARLKGDYLDHLKGQKWSFRIKVKKGDSFRGMTTFSIQNPQSRFFLHEWLMHKVFVDEGIISPRYGFIPVIINSKMIGIYAYEEHFEKQIVESQQRREGPIIKFDDFAYWYNVLLSENNDNFTNYLSYESSVIVPFAESKTLANPILLTEFNIAKNLVFQHKYFLAKPSDIFDVDLLAKYYALVTVQRLFHGTLWINQRYYYNPITSKLEIIAFDCFTQTGPFNYISRTIYGDFNPLNINNNQPSEKINLYLFSDSIFVKKYISYLNKYSEKNYWDTVFAKYNDELNNYEKFLQKEYKDFVFDRNYFYTNANNVKSELPNYEQKVENGLYKNMNISIIHHNTNSVPNSLIVSNLVKIYTQNISDDSVYLKVQNYNPTNIQLVSYFIAQNEYFYSPNNIEAYKLTSPGEAQITLPADIDSLKFSATGLDSTFFVDVLPWREPAVWTPRQELENNNKFPNQPFYNVVDSLVIFSGSVTVNELIFIPKGYNVIFEAGCRINFIDSSAFLSYSPVFIRGTKSSKVNIFSLDRTAKGFTVIQGGKVEMSYASFNSFNTFSYKGWALSGAVTIYESDIKISNCKFVNNSCEDDLNIVRSYFDVSNSLFKNTFSDAFDSDFSTGKVTDCEFVDLGNDAIDFSTSKIIISNCSITNANDKGISGGEASELSVNDCVIDGAVIGIASKDKSLLTINNVDIKNATYVLAAFQKKPEYGPAKIIATNITAKNYLQIALIEKKSTLILDNLPIQGRYKKVADMFY